MNKDEISFERIGAPPSFYCKDPFKKHYITMVKKSTYKWITNFHKDERSIYYGAIKNSGLSEHLTLLNIGYDMHGRAIEDYCALCFTDINDDRDLTHFWKAFDRTKKRVEEGYSPVERDLDMC